MARRPPKTLDSEDVIRIAFLLDFRRNPELSHLREMTNQGDRPRELIRLAELGVRYEQETQRIADAVRSAGLAPVLQQGASAGVAGGSANGNGTPPAPNAANGAPNGISFVRPAEPAPAPVDHELNPLPRRASPDSNAEAAQRVRGMLG